MSKTKTDILPEHLKGPFVCSFYDRKTATIYLKHPDGSWDSTITYPSFFIAKKDVRKFPFDEYGKYILERIEEGKYIRLVRDSMMDNDVLQEMISICRAENVEPYEADVSPVRRWFSDTGSLVEKKYRSLFFDLETHPLKIGFDNEAKKQHRVISFAAYDQEGNSFFEAAKESSEAEEILLLKKFVALIEKYDTILAWNGDDYDFFVLTARCKRHGLHVPWHKWNRLDHMRVVKKVLMSISDSAFKRSFALNAIGENVLGIKKIKLAVGGGEMHKLLGARESELKEYNMRDVEIMLKVEEKKGFLDLHYTLCSFCRTFPNRGSIYPNELADGILLRLALQEGKHFKARDMQERDENKKKYEGAYVMDPVVGFHKDVQVPDFASLYPSIILSWNMSNETMLHNGKSYPDFDGQYAKAPSTGVCFRTDIDGIIPKALRSLIATRKEYTNKAKGMEVGSDEWKNMNNLSTAVKVVTNSFYGLIGNEGSRFYEQEIARSVTLNGQWLIKQVAAYVEKCGYRVIYGDTDSLFIVCSPDNLRKELEYINGELIPTLLRNVGCKTCDVRMDYDKSFATLLLVSKKRYVGKLALHKGRVAPDDMEPEIKGLETQRSDQVRYSQKLLKKFMPLLIREDTSPNQIDEMLRDECDIFFKTDLRTDDIEITQSVQKHPEEYNPKTAVVKVAQKMIDDGKEFFRGMKVPIIVIEYKNNNAIAIHSDEYEGRCDRKYYWEHKILPSLQRLLDARYPNFPFNSFKHPGQGIFNFDALPIEVATPKSKNRIRGVQPPTQEIKLPTSKVTQRRKRQPAAFITFPVASESQIIGVAKLVHAYPGNMKLVLSLTVGKDEVVIPTDETISMEGLKEIKKIFPMLKINPNPT